MEKLNQDRSWCRTPYQLMHDKNLTRSDVDVYSTLLDQCTDELVCSLTLATICELTGLANRTVRYCLERLEKYGYIERTRTGRASIYKLADIIGLKRKTKQQSKPSHTPEEPEQETKLRYGEYQNVLLTVAEFDKLVSDFGTAKANNYVQKCDSYCQSTGKCYADYDATIRRWIDSDVKKSLPEDDVKRQEFSEIDEYLQLVNRFDDLDSTTEAPSKPVQTFQHENQETIPLNQSTPKNSIRSDLNGIGYSMPKDNIKRQEFSEIDFLLNAQSHK